MPDYIGAFIRFSYHPFLYSFSAFLQGAYRLHSYHIAAYIVYALFVCFIYNSYNSNNSINDNEWGERMGVPIRSDDISGDSLCIAPPPDVCFSTQSV